MNDFPIDDNDFHGRDFVIAANTEMKRSQRCIFQTEELKKFLSATPKSRCYFFLWGEVRYLDGFSSKHRFTKFCHRYESTGLRAAYNDVTGSRYEVITADSMRLHQYGNDAD